MEHKRKPSLELGEIIKILVIVKLSIAILQWFFEVIAEGRDTHPGLCYTSKIQKIK